MALPTIENVTNQMLNESVREQPTVTMKGNVTRPMIIGDLLRAMNDVNFKELVEEYGSMAGITNTKATPMTNALMSERERVPQTPLQTQTANAPKAPAAVVDEIKQPIAVPTPMSNAMAQNNMSPIGSIEEQQQGLMSNAPQQIA